MTPKAPQNECELIELKELYAVVGNADNTPLPIVNPQTGEEMPILDKKWLNRFVGKYSVQYRKLFGWTERIQRYTGKRLRNLKDIAFKNTPETRHLIEETRQRILDDLDFLRKICPEARDHMLRLYGRLADEYINETIQEFFPEYEHELGLKNEVATCHDAAKLLLMCFDTTLDPRLRYEARRKLFLMEYIGQLENFNEEDRGHEEALNAMIDFMNRKMTIVPAGKKRGTSSQRFLLSRHNAKEGNRTETASIIKALPERKKHNERITPIGMRQAIIMDQKGRGREIYFYAIPREKGTYSRLTKMFRYGTKIGERDDDRNGIRMVFEKKQDWVDFFMLLQKQLKEEIAEELTELLDGETDETAKKKLEEKRLDLDKSVIISNEKDNLEGDGRFMGNSKASSSATKFLKFTMKVCHADGKKCQYEFQIFLPNGFADYIYRKGVSWAEYQVKRFFKEQVAEILFPSAIFPQIDKKEAMEKAMERAYQQAWHQNNFHAARNGISREEAQRAKRKKQQSGSLIIQSGSGGGTNNPNGPTKPGPTAGRVFVSRSQQERRGKKK